MGLEKSVMSCIHHYGITQSIFTALKILFTPSVHPFCCPPQRKPLATTDLLIVSIVLPIKNLNIFLSFHRYAQLVVYRLPIFHK